MIKRNVCFLVVLLSQQVFYTLLRSAGCCICGGPETHCQQGRCKVLSWMNYATLSLITRLNDVSFSCLHFYKI